jgi:hypothetical protein
VFDMTVGNSEERVIDALCDQFESEWQAGKRPRLEDYVDRLPIANKERLLVELLHIDVARRKELDEEPTPEEYVIRFPQYTELILQHTEVFGRTSIDSGVAHLLRLGDYRIDEPIGKGGMGIVYRATHEILNRTVAIKVLPPDASSKTAFQRFRKEIQAIGCLDHQHIVRATDAGELEGRLFLVMEYVEGIDAARLLRKWNQLPIDVACEIVRQTALGLQHIADHNLVHRDIKPSNLMVSVGGDVKILDLGLARFNLDLRPGELTRTGQVMGTIDYVAPEQVNEPSRVDIRADIYSLGCTFFHFLTGQPPFGDTRDGTLARLMAHASKEISAVRDLRADCPRGLDEILRAMVAKKPEHRYAQPIEVANRLSEFCRPAGHDALRSLAAEFCQSATVSPPSVHLAHETQANVTTNVVPCPYPGLRAFTREDKDFFFGREDHIEQLADKLSRNRFLAVVGPSGCGKSSMVLAGLLPHLEDGFVEGVGPHWRYAVMRPGEAPFERLTAALLDEHALGKERGTGPKVETLLEVTLRRGPWGLSDAINETGLEPRTNLVLVVDQFEELFRYHKLCLSRGTTFANDADAFVNLLLTPTRDPDRDKRLRSLAVYVVITMRWDFLDDQFSFTGLTEAMNDSVFFTPRLTRDQCEMAIVGPARVQEWEIDRVLVNRLLNDTITEPDQLPLLQHALMRMWTRAALAKNKGRLTLNDYDGSPELSLSNHANEIYDTCNSKHQYVVRKMFQSLADRGQSQQVTRRPAPVQEVARTADSNPGDVKIVADKYRRSDTSFLMPPETVPLTDETVLDISHECLLRKWDRMQSWLEEESHSAEMYRRLLKAARLWASHGSSRPLSGMDEVLEWQERERPNATWANRYGGEFELVQSYIEYCKRHQAQRHQIYDYDAFLCHSPEDKPTVRDVAEKLRQHHIRPWFDDWELAPGKTWQNELATLVDRIGCAVVFVGPKCEADWQSADLQLILKKFLDRNRPVIPALLPGAGREVPVCLRNLTCVDFRTQHPDPMERLIWGITGERPKPQV